MKKKRLSTYKDFKCLGKYEFFLSNVNETENKIFFSLRKDKRQLIWLARPIDRLGKIDSDANSFFLVGSDGTHGIVFRKKDQRFRIVPLHQPLKVIPKIRRKFKVERTKKH